MQVFSLRSSIDQSIMSSFLSPTTISVRAAFPGRLELSCLSSIGLHSFHAWADQENQHFISSRHSKLRRREVSALLDSFRSTYLVGPRRQTHISRSRKFSGVNALKRTIEKAGWAAALAGLKLLGTLSLRPCLYFPPTSPLIHHVANHLTLSDMA